jgi:hemoglobin
MKRDISSRQDLHLIVSEFYKDLLENEELNRFFKEFRDETKLRAHLEILVDFWDNTLFYSGSYSKNAIKPHIKIHSDKVISASNFENWLMLFNKAVDENFQGQNADTIKARALSIATVMKIKLNIF